LTPTFPTRFGPCDPAASRVSSLGVVQRSPLHRTRSRSPTPGRSAQLPPATSPRPAPAAHRTAFPRNGKILRSAPQFSLSASPRAVTRPRGSVTVRITRVLAQTVAPGHSPGRTDSRCSVAPCTMTRPCGIATSPLGSSAPVLDPAGSAPWLRGDRCLPARAAASRLCRVSASSDPPSRWGRQSPSACRPRGFPPPRRFFPSRPRDRIAGRCRSWGSPRFLLSRNRISRGAPAALRSFPSADSDVCRDESRPPLARVTVWSVSDPSRSPRTLPSRPFSSGGHPRRETAASFLRKPRPQGFAPSSGPLRARPFPAARTRCSLGLVRAARLARSGAPLRPLPREGQPLAMANEDETSHRGTLAVTSTLRRRTLRRAPLSA
jgi:hypothetical protein